MTPLISAAREWHLPVVEALLAAGANKEAVDKVHAACARRGWAGTHLPVVAVTGAAAAPLSHAHVCDACRARCAV